MPNKVDITGMTFGRLIVLGEAGHKNGRRQVQCSCSCGSVIVCDPRSVKQGHTSSCGCLQRERVADAARQRTVHGDTRSKEYNTWIKIRDRCGNPNNKKYQDYGGRGISVCDRWDSSYEAFLADMGRSPSASHSIDRYPDNDGNYEPGNCRWATNLEQARNKRRHRFVSLNGGIVPLSEACEAAGVNYRSALYRLNSGKSWLPKPPVSSANEVHERESI